jgi:hypothetical protein
MANAFWGALAGAAGGLAGSWMMVRFNHLIDHEEEPGRPERAPQYRRDAKPNETDGTIPDEPGSMQAASAVAEMATGRPLSERGKRIGGPIAHYAFGAVAGGLYGAIAEANRSATAGFGLPFGTAVWITADEIGMPLLGFASSPTDYPLSRHAAALGTHLVYGATVEGVRRILRGSPPA